MIDRINNLFPTYRSGSQGAACNTTFEPFGGLTLRDLFAMAALNSIANEPPMTSDQQPDGTFIDCDRAGRLAYRYADAMLAARKENQE